MESCDFSKRRPISPSSWFAAHSVHSETHESGSCFCVRNYLLQTLLDAHGFCHRLTSAGPLQVLCNPLFWNLSWYFGHVWQEMKVGSTCFSIINRCIQSVCRTCKSSKAQSPTCNVERPRTLSRKGGELLRCSIDGGFLDLPEKHIRALAFAVKDAPCRSLLLAACWEALLSYYSLPSFTDLSGVSYPFSYFF